ncbi:MAG: asparagine--tRNA ligase, partial [Bacteroidales bacterium]|nr:asparagine--tRNA ligase [Bacteroidales bacterium]
MSQKTEIKALLQATELDTQVTVKGWVKNFRGNSYVMFAAVNDGSSLQNIQIVFDTAKFNENDLKKITVGCSLSVNGTLKASEGKGQRVEVVAESFEVLGACDPDKYPIQPKKHSLEFLRENAHLRFRTNLFGAIMRVRHNMIYAIHTFFTERGFYNIHTPIITASDCEGAGEMFQVTTLDLNNLPKNEDGTVDYSEDFFGNMANRTVSGQLEVELACMALSKVYTFGPTFRAENSNTTRHLAEFWMIEPEIAFADINDDMDIAEEFLKYLIQYALDHCREDLEFLQERLI